MKRIFKIAIVASSYLLVFGSYAITRVAFYNEQLKQKRTNELKGIWETYYLSKLTQYNEENKTINNIEVCCLGDSLTDGYDLHNYYPQFNIVNRGIGGDTTHGLKARLKVSAYDANPKVVTMLIGANNFKTMFEDYEEIVVNLRENLPNSHLVLLSLTSMTKEWGRNNEIAKKNNVEIKKYAEKYGCTYVDLFNPLLDSNTNALKEEYTTDGGHLTPLGYQVVTDVITPVLTELLQ